MKKIIITQRFEKIGKFNELRDNIDSRLPNLIQKSLRKNFYAHDLDSYVSLIDNNTFNFDLTDFDAKIVKHFFHGGRLVDVKITDLQMKIFLENNKNSLQIFTKFHIKKIDHFKNQIG